MPSRLRSTLAAVQDAADMFRSLGPDAVQAMEEESSRVGQAANDLAQLVPDIRRTIARVNATADAVTEAATAHRNAMELVEAIAWGVVLGCALYSLTEYFPGLKRLLP